MPRTVGAVLFDGFELLDLFGPLQMFGLRNDAFEISLIAAEPGPVASGQGPSALAVADLSGRYDLLLVPGGRARGRALGIQGSSRRSKRFRNRPSWC